MTELQNAGNADALIRELLEEVRRCYITESSALLLMLGGGSQSKRDLHIIDMLYHSALTSLQFGQTRRAVRYLEMFFLMCQRVFGDSGKKSALWRLETKILN